MRQATESAEDVQTRFERLLANSTGSSIDQHERYRIAIIASERRRHLYGSNDLSDAALQGIVLPLCAVWVAMRGRTRNPWQSLWKVLQRWAFHSVGDLRIIAILCRGENFHPAEIEELLTEIKMALPDDWRRDCAAVLITEGGGHTEAHHYIDVARVI